MKEFDKAQLEASISREYMKIKHSKLWRVLKPNQAERADIDKIVKATIDAAGIGSDQHGKQVSDLSSMNSEVRKKLAHEMVVGYIDYQRQGFPGKINPAYLVTGSKVVEFDGVFSALKSKFALRSEDYKKLFEQYNKIHSEFAGKLSSKGTKGLEEGSGANIASITAREHLDKALRTNTENFINAFGGAQGGKNRVDRSVLFTKEFTEAIKLNHNNPEIGPDLLVALKRDKPFNPKELCKAFNACMEGVQAIRNSTHPEQGKDQKAKFNRDVKEFLDMAVPTIKDAKHIDKKVLAEVKGMTNIADDNAQAKRQFAEKAASQSQGQAQVAR